MLWLLRRREADAERDKVVRDIEARSTALEGHLAELRATERELEDVRTAHYGAAMPCTRRRAGCCRSTPKWPASSRRSG